MGGCQNETACTGSAIAAVNALQNETSVPSKATDMCGSSRAALLGCRDTNKKRNTLDIYPGAPGPRQIGYASEGTVDPTIPVVVETLEGFHPRRIGLVGVPIALLAARRITLFERKELRGADLPSDTHAGQDLTRVTHAFFAARLIDYSSFQAASHHRALAVLCHESA